MLGTIIASFVLLFILIAIIAFFLFVFWILMIVDCVKRDFKNDSEKIVWILVLIFLHFLGATIYYFAVKRESNEIKKGKKI